MLSCFTVIATVNQVTYRTPPAMELNYINKIIIKCHSIRLLLLICKISL